MTDIAVIERKLDAVLAAVARLERSRPSDQLMTPKEVARKYRLSEAKIYTVVRAGLIPVSEHMGRGGKRCFLIAPKDAERQWGPK